MAGCRLGIAVVIAILIAANGIYAQVFNSLIKGIWTTLFVTAVGFSLACLLGLGLAIMGLSRFKALRQIARFYVEIIRGIPMLVLLFYIAFVGAPAFVAFWNFITSPLQSIGFFGPMGIRDFSLLVARDHRVDDRLFGLFVGSVSRRHSGR